MKPVTVGNRNESKTTRHWDLKSRVHDGVNTYESGRVVVTGGLSITIGFQNRVSLNDLVFQGAHLEARGRRKKTHKTKLSAGKEVGRRKLVVEPCDTVERKVYIQDGGGRGT